MYVFLEMFNLTISNKYFVIFQSGEFTVPEPGLYLFLVTLCTYDMKKCLISIRKNGKDVANIHDQDGDTNKVIHYYKIK